MTWTDPTMFSTGDRFTAARRGREWRDNLKFLYAPPHARATNPNPASITAAQFIALDFPKTIFDNDGIHGAEEGLTLQHEPNSGVMSASRRGLWLAHADIDFEWSTTGEQEIRLGFRYFVTSAGGWAGLYFKSSGSANSGGPRTIIPIEGAWIHSSTTERLQMSVLAYSAVDDGSKLVTEYNRFPYFYVHWIAGVP